jgi:hypothetical protein
MKSIIMSLNVILRDRLTVLFGRLKSMHLLLKVLFLYSTLTSFVSSPKNILEDAYQENSKQKLHVFFEDWAKQSAASAMDYSEQKNGIEKECFMLLRTFFDSEAWKGVDKNHSFSDYLDSSNYFFFSPELHVEITHRKLYYSKVEQYKMVMSQVQFNCNKDSACIKKYNELFFPNNADTNWAQIGFIIHIAMAFSDTNLVTNNDKNILIKNFRPKDLFSNKKVVYMTPKYEKLILSFLVNKSRRFGLAKKVKTEEPVNEVEKRLKFLRPFMFPVYGHWGGYWYLHSFPEPLQITFSNDFNVAEITFRHWYTSQTVLFLKKAGKWKIEEFGLGWIE